MPDGRRDASFTRRYDDYNRLAEETAYEGSTPKTRKYVYDGSGNLTITVDRNGRAIRSKYDRLDRLQTEWWYATETDARNNATTTVATAHSDAIDSFYDDLGRLAERRSVHRTLAGTYAFDSRVTESFAYDGLDRVTERSNQSLENPATLSTSGAPAAKQTYVYEYNGPHLQIGRWQWVSGVAVAFTSSWTGPFGELTDVTDVDAGAELSYEQYAATFAYDKSGALTTTTRSTDWDAAISGYRNEVQTAYGYDKAGRLQGLTHQFRRRDTATWPTLFTQLVTFGYGYDDASRIDLLVTGWNNNLAAFPAASRPSTLTNFTYDDAGQLTSVNEIGGPNDATYGYGLNGNRTTSTEAGGSDSYAAPGPQNRVAGDSTYTYVYDAEGNLKERRITSGNVLDQKYTWDHRNRLVKVENFTGGTADETVDYRYDAGGDMVYREARVLLGAQWYTTELEHIVVETGRRTMTLDSDGDVMRRYHYGPANDAMFDQVFDETGNPTSQTEFDLRLPLGDHQNSTRALLRHDAGDVIYIRESVDYSPFGQIRAILDSSGSPFELSPGVPDKSALDTVFAWDGLVYDRFADFLLTAARPYSADLGRFVSVDPIEDGSNWYMAFGNDPVNFADPSGLSPSFHPLGNSTLSSAYIDSRSILSGGGGTGLNFSGNYFASPGVPTYSTTSNLNFQPVNLGLGGNSATSSYNALANYSTPSYQQTTPSASSLLFNGPKPTTPFSTAPLTSFAPSSLASANDLAFAGYLAADAASRYERVRPVINVDARELSELSRTVHSPTGPRVVDVQVLRQDTSLRTGAGEGPTNLLRLFAPKFGDGAVVTFEDGTKRIINGGIDTGSGLSFATAVAGPKLLRTPSAPKTSVWTLGPGERGLAIESQLGGNLPKGFPVVDRFSNGVATSIKSIDLTAPSYQNTANLTRTLNGHVDNVANFNGATRARTAIRAAEISARELQLAVQPGVASAAQKAAINAAVERAQGLGVNFRVTPIR